MAACSFVGKRPCYWIEKGWTAANDGQCSSDFILVFRRNVTVINSNEVEVISCF